MSGLDQMLRLQKFSLDEKRRQAADLDALIERLRGDVRRLDEDVAREIETARGNLDLERALPEYREVIESKSPVPFRHDNGEVTSVVYIDHDRLSGRQSPNDEGSGKGESKSDGQ